MRITCEQCCYWQPPQAEERLGECRRKPPVHEFWPVTQATDWCGQAMPANAGSTQPEYVDPYAAAKQATVKDCLTVGEELAERSKLVDHTNEDAVSPLVKSLAIFGKQMEQQVTDLREEQRLLGDLLAVIHRDGGHHLAEYGVEQSCADAAESVVKLRRELTDALDDLRECQRELAEAKLWIEDSIRRCSERNCSGREREVADLRGELAEERDKALRFDLDAAGIETREAQAIELVELRRDLRECQRELVRTRERLLDARRDAVETQITADHLSRILNRHDADAAAARTARDLELSEALAALREIATVTTPNRWSCNEAMFDAIDAWCEKHEAAIKAAREAKP